jgi:hypothetical protein
MSIAKVCDRCDAILKINTTNWTEVEITRHMNTSLFRTSNYEKYDLCDECLGKLHRFLKNEIVTDA